VVCNKDNLSAPSYYIVVKTWDWGDKPGEGSDRVFGKQLGPDFLKQLDSLPSLSARVPIWSSPGASGSISSRVPSLWSKVGEQIFRTAAQYLQYSPARCQLTSGAPCLRAPMSWAGQDLEVSRR
jgi:hypothetical protein